VFEKFWGGTCYFLLKFHYSVFQIPLSTSQTQHLCDIDLIAFLAWLLFLGVLKILLFFFIYITSIQSYTIQSSLTERIEWQNSYNHTKLYSSDDLPHCIFEGIKRFRVFYFEIEPDGSMGQRIQKELNLKCLISFQSVHQCGSSPEKWNLVAGTWI
jgi:hypothetical protein